MIYSFLTIYINWNKNIWKNENIKLSLTPSGVLYPNCIPVIASGCVVDLGVLMSELKMLKEKNVHTSKLKLSSNAHLIMPYHKLLDELIETKLGKNIVYSKKIGIMEKFKLF